MGKEDESRILSVEEVLHLHSDTHTKKGEVMPEVDTSRYVLNQKPKTEVARNFAPVVNITEEQRRQFNQGSNTVKSRNAILAEQARQAIKIAEQHVEEEAIEQAKAAEEKTAKTDNTAKKLVSEIKSGNFDFSFGALIEGSENLKETI
jgi:uncharacterized protein YjcR